MRSEMTFLTLKAWQTAGEGQPPEALLDHCDEIDGFKNDPRCENHCDTLVCGQNHERTEDARFSLQRSFCSPSDFQISFEPGFGAYQGLAQKIKVPFSRIFSFFLQF